MPIVYAAFFRAPSGHDHDHDHDHGEAPFPMVLALTLTAAGTIGLFFFSEIPLALARSVAGLT